MVAAHALAVDALFLHMCTDEWLPTASTLCPPQSSLQKAHPVTLKANLKWTIPENFMTIGGCFERYVYCVTALGWLKKERKNLRR